MSASSSDVPTLRVAVHELGNLAAVVRMQAELIERQSPTGGVVDRARAILAAAAAMERLLDLIAEAVPPE